MISYYGIFRIPYLVMGIWFKGILLLGQNAQVLRSPNLTLIHTVCEIFNQKNHQQMYTAHSTSHIAKTAVHNGKYGMQKFANSIA